MEEADGDESSGALRGEKPLDRPAAEAFGLNAARTPTGMLASERKRAGHQAKELSADVVTGE